jgi:hypothetical protein
MLHTTAFITAKLSSVYLGECLGSIIKKPATKPLPTNKSRHLSSCLLYQQVYRLKFCERFSLLIHFTFLELITFIVLGERKTINFMIM